MWRHGDSCHMLKALRAKTNITGLYEVKVLIVCVSMCVCWGGWGLFDAELWRRCMRHQLDFKVNTHVILYDQEMSNVYI